MEKKSKLGKRSHNLKMHSKSVPFKALVLYNLGTIACFIYERTLVNIFKHVPLGTKCYF